MKTERKQELIDIFRNVDDDKRKLIMPLIDEVVWLETELDNLKKLPQIRTHPADPARQKITEAAKLYKKRQESYMNAIRILLSTLNKVETSAQDSLLELLEKYA